MAVSVSVSVRHPSSSTSASLGGVNGVRTPVTRVSLLLLLPWHGLSFPPSPISPPRIALFAVHVPRLEGNRKLIIPNGVPELPFNQAGKGSPYSYIPSCSRVVLLCLSLLVLRGKWVKGGRVERMVLRGNRYANEISQIAPFLYVYLESRILFLLDASATASLLVPNLLSL
jgi:hypothetical protein